MNNNLQKSAQRNINNNQMTPMYTKNPNMSNNKINEILNLSRDMHTDCIEPSPSGITRCYVKFDDPAPAPIKREVPKPVADYVQVEYQNPSKHKPYSMAEMSQTRDCSTSPFVFLKSQLNEIEPKVNEKMRLEASKAVIFSGLNIFRSKKLSNFIKIKMIYFFIDFIFNLKDAATQFNETQAQFVETAVQNTPVVTKKNESMYNSIETSALPIVSEEPTAPIIKGIPFQQLYFSTNLL